MKKYWVCVFNIVSFMAVWVLLPMQGYGQTAEFSPRRITLKNILLLCLCFLSWQLYAQVGFSRKYVERFETYIHRHDDLNKQNPDFSSSTLPGSAVNGGGRGFSTSLLLPYTGLYTEDAYGIFYVNTGITNNNNGYAGNYYAATNYLTFDSLDWEMELRFKVLERKPTADSHIWFIGVGRTNNPPFPSSNNEVGLIAGSTNDTLYVFADSAGVEFKTGVGVVVPNKWYTLTIKYDGNTTSSARFADIYVDGVFVKKQTRGLVRGTGMTPGWSISRAGTSNLQNTMLVDYVKHYVNTGLR